MMFRRRMQVGSDMTSGNIIRKLAYFAVPIMFGNLFQQLYNAVDAMVVGNFVSDDALAAVGATGPLINMIISFAMGMFAGAGVMVARYYGARDRKNLHKAIHTSLTLAAIMGAAMSIAGIAAAKPLLRLMGTPEEIMPDAVQYLTIYYSGLIALSIYNSGASILNALGNSHLPLFFLIVSCIINIVGDLLFTLLFDFGIAGVAVSTVIAEAVSVVLVVLALHRGKGERLLVFKDLRLSYDVLKQIVGIGLPTAIQGTIVSFSNVIVQSYFNGLGKISVAGYTAAQKIDAFVQLPVQTMAIAVATFVGQNLGAGQVKRARQGVRYSMLLGIAVTICISILTLSFNRAILRVFTPDPNVLEAGVQFLWVFAPFQFILCGTQIIPGALRGAGRSRFPTAACVISFVGLRQLYLLFMTRRVYTITAVAMGYPITWSFAAVAIFIYYLRSDWSQFEKEAVA